MIDQTILRWADNHRSRKHCVEAVMRMLTYAVTHEKLSEDWNSAGPPEGTAGGQGPEAHREGHVDR